MKSLRVALSALHERGLHTAECLEGTGVTESDLSRPDLRVSLHQELAFYRNVLRLTNDPLIGLAIGPQYHLPNYGIWGYAVMSAPDLRAALRLAFRFIGLTYTCHDITLEAGDARACIRLVPLRDYAECSQVITDRDASALVLIVSELLGQRLPLERVDLCHAGAAFAEQYRAHFRCPVSFGNPCSELHMPPSVMDMRLPHSDPNTTRLTEYQCEMLQTSLAAAHDIAAEIRHILMENPGRFPTLEDTAERLRISPRNLRRRLSEAGCSFTGIQNDLRYELARQFLDVTPLTIQEIANTLGYTEPGNFSHAFKRWSGISPHAYRTRGNAG